MLVDSYVLPKKPKPLTQKLTFQLSKQSKMTILKLPESPYSTRIFWKPTFPKFPTSAKVS